MKTSFLLIPLLFISLLSQGQTYLGVKILPETNYIDNDQIEETVNFSGGIIMIHNFEKVDLETGVYFYQTGAKYSETLNDHLGKFIDMANYTVKYQYFAIPLYLHYQLGKVYLTGGLATNYLVNGQVTEDKGYDDLKVIFKNFAFQGKAGIGYKAPFSEKSSISVEFNVKPFLTPVDLNFAGSPIVLGLGIILMREI